jgi:hypothetical protein
MRQVALIETEVNLFNHLFSNNIGPHAKRQVVCYLIKKKIRLGPAVSSLVLVVLVFPLNLSPFFVRVDGVLLNVGKHVLANVVVLLAHDLSDLVNILLAPIYLLVVVLRQGFTQDKVNCLNYIFSNLAVVNCIL